MQSTYTDLGILKTWTAVIFSILVAGKRVVRDISSLYLPTVT